MLTRRILLRRTAAFVSLEALLAACSAVPTTAPVAAKPAALQLPAYADFPGPPPDLPGSADGVQPVYVNYPKNPVKSVRTPPGKGGEINALTNTVNPPPPPMEQNPAWQEVKPAAWRHAQDQRGRFV